ncbi:hypothetical protein AVEN_146671-1 [Araneus ventricosus]|uniref:RNase H type-1 domain-containing protein n=1 Tax=Araneus ventricosus TaxID=182803 RepID=A0A4Y2KMJ5_ARAVE|nr:hypothetical protein AVEN_146671-1 [Araneus ventricosus]
MNGREQTNVNERHVRLWAGFILSDVQPLTNHKGEWLHHPLEIDLAHDNGLWEIFTLRWMLPSQRMSCFEAWMLSRLVEDLIRELQVKRGIINTSHIQLPTDSSILLNVFQCLQWIPSHVDIYRNEVADDLAKQGTAEPLCSTPSLTFDEIYSIRKNKDLKTWRVPPSHDWCKRSSPGGSIGLACDRADETALCRFVSGHLRSCSFSHGNKGFPVCAKCGVASASPERILSCLRLSRETFETDPLLALDLLRVNGLMDGV